MQPDDESIANNISQASPDVTDTSNEGKETPKPKRARRTSLSMLGTSQSISEMSRDRREKSVSGSPTSDACEIEPLQPRVRPEKDAMVDRGIYSTHERPMAKGHLHWSEYGNLPPARTEIIDGKPNQQGPAHRRVRAGPLGRRRQGRGKAEGVHARGDERRAPQRPRLRPQPNHSPADLRGLPTWGLRVLNVLPGQILVHSGLDRAVLERLQTGYFLFFFPHSLSLSF